MSEQESTHNPQSNQNTWSGPIEWMARNAIASNLLMIILIGGGIWAMFNAQKEVYPQFALDIVEVSVTYPGAAPEEVEQGVLQPIEEAIRGIEGIKEITSTAWEGSASVEIELVSGTNRQRAFQDIDQAVNRIRTFPDNIDRPEVRLQSERRDVMQISLYGDTEIWSIRKKGEQLRDRLLSHPAITQVEISNVPDYVTHVEIPRHRLREYHLTLQEVAQIIEQSSRDIPAGAIDTSQGEILLRMNERKLTAEEFGQIELISSKAGGTIRLTDIATIHDGFEEDYFPSQFNRQPAIELGIFRVGSQSPLEIESAVQSILDDFETNLPPGLQTRIDGNQASDYRERMALLMENGLLAILIVLTILTIFLEYHLAFWIMMGMTISFIGGILFLPTFGVSINMISMFGFLVVLGIVVDDAIVVGENVYEYRERGMDFMNAAIQGTRDIALPVIFSILSNIVAFIPLMFMPGTTGKFWWPLPVVVIIVLAISLFEALFILPAHLGHSSPGASTSLGQYVHRKQGQFADWFTSVVDRYFRPFLRFCLRYRYITLTSAITLFIVVAAYANSAHMGMITMPEEAANEIETGIRLPVDTTLEQADRVATDVTNATYRMFQEHNLDRVAEGIKTNLRGSSFIDVEIVMKPPTERDMTARDVIQIWRDSIGDIDGVEQMTFEAERGPGGWRDDIVVDLSHSDIDVLEQASQNFFRKAKQFESTADVNDNYDRGKSQFNFKLLPEGRHLGLTPSEVGQQLRNAFFGAVAMRQLRGTNEVEIRVKLPHEQRKDIQHLENLVLQTDDGTEVPLMDVVTFKQGKAFNSINRRDGRRVVSVGMNVEPKRNMARILNAINHDVLPELQNQYPGLTWSFEGSQAEMRESAQTLWGAFALAMAVIYALLAIAFGNYTQPIIVLFAIPFGIVGAVIGHILLGYDLSLISLMGVIALSGVVVNDSLIMVDYANKLRKKHTPFKAIHKAGIRRFRPIILTTLTTFGGLTPIILETSRQATYIIPMAISLGFGILFATSIILVIVPSLYLVREDLRSLR